MAFRDLWKTLTGRSKETEEELPITDTEIRGQFNPETPEGQQALSELQAMSSRRSGIGDDINWDELEAAERADQERLRQEEEQKKALRRAHFEDKLAMQKKKEEVSLLRARRRQVQAAGASTVASTGLQALKGVKSVVGVPMPAERRNELYFGKAQKTVYGKMPLRADSFPMMNAAGQALTPNLGKIRSISMGGAAPLMNLEGLRKTFDLSSLRRAGQPSSSARPGVTESKSYLQPAIPVGESYEDSYQGPVAFWIGTRRGWEASAPGSVIITKTRTGTYRFRGLGAQTGQERSKLIGKDPDRADEIAGKMRR